MIRKKNVPAQTVEKSSMKWSNLETEVAPGLFIRLKIVPGTFGHYLSSTLVSVQTGESIELDGVNMSVEAVERGWDKTQSIIDFYNTFKAMELATKEGEK